MRADLHLHSSASDGTRSPAEVVRRAAAARIDVIALTDHDTVAGLGQATQALPPGMSLVPGMELSCRRGRRSVHLLCYLFDPDHAELAAQCAAIRRSRVHRAREMVSKLEQLETGVSWEQVARIAAGGVVGRPHVARAMVEAGVVSSVAEAFTPAWIGPGGPAYVAKYALDPAHAVALVRAAGGAAVLAHPRAGTRGGPAPDELIAELAAAGLAGLEVAHPDHDAAQRAGLAALAGQLGLVRTGGSDDHGELTGDRIGSELAAPAEVARLLGQASGASVIAR